MGSTRRVTVAALAVGAVALIAVVYPMAFAWLGFGANWSWWTAAPPASMVSAETQHNSMAVNHLMELHPGEWGGLWIQGEGLGINTVTRNVNEATQYLRAQGITGDLTVTRVTRSMPELEALTLRVQKALGDDWGPIVMFGPVAARNAVVIDMQWPDPWLLHRLHEVAAEGLEVRWYPGPKPRTVLA